MKKEIEVGKTYRTRGCHNCVIIGEFNKYGYGFYVEIDGDKDWITKDGKYWSEEMYPIKGDSEYDIVFEEEKPLIKIGNYTDQYGNCYLVIDGVLTDIDGWSDVHIHLLKHLGYDIELFYIEEVLKSKML